MYVSVCSYLDSYAFGYKLTKYNTFLQTRLPLLYLKQSCFIPINVFDTICVCYICNLRLIFLYLELFLFVFVLN